MRGTVVGLFALAVTACSSDREGGPVFRPAATDPTTTRFAPPQVVTSTTSTTTTSTSTAPAVTAATTMPSTSTEATTAPATTTTTMAAPPPAADAIAGAAVALQPWVDLPLLTAMATRPGEAASYLTSQSGEVWRVADGAAPELVLDLTGVVSPYVDGSERGLLGVAFGPVDGRLYVSYTDADIDSHVVSYAVDAAGRPDPASALEVVYEDQPGLGHKGGGLAFEPNGTMYLALGDGGASSGRDAQDYTTVLGGIMRVVPRQGAAGYDVPADNPYVADPSVRPEIWAKGLRNPWGFCRDAATGDLWFADVGNNTMEEIDRLPAGLAGANFGWYYVEGTSVRHDGAPADAVAPVHAYGRDVGPAAIGGCVYRGADIPGLAGAYVFGDLTGQLFAIGAGDEVVPMTSEVGGVLTGFGTAPDGELVALTLFGGALRLVAG